MVSDLVLKRINIPSLVKRLKTTLRHGFTMRQQTQA
jgi:hypothetical protein